MCGRCLTHPPSFAATCAAVPYSAPWDALVRQFKFHQGTEAARVMAQLMALAIARSQAAGQAASMLAAGEIKPIQAANHSSAICAQPELIVPIACSNTRMCERGYNQAWELGKPLARLLGIAIHPHCLKRPQEEGSQTHRTRAERLRALKTAFTVAPAAQAQLEGKHIALVDDVMTTGATLEAAAHVLQAAGVARVTAWVFARTPEHRVTR